MRGVSSMLRVPVQSPHEGAWPLVDKVPWVKGDDMESVRGIGLCLCSRAGIVISVSDSAIILDVHVVSWKIEVWQEPAHFSTGVEVDRGFV